MMEYNIVLVTVDCFRYDKCNFNGYRRSQTTEILSDLLSESYIFDNAFATGPWTAESIPGILAGLHSFDCSYHQDISWKAIPKDSPTVASHLSKHGYETSAVVTNPHITPVRNFDKGFDRFQNLRLQSEQDPDIDIENQFGGEIMKRIERLYPAFSVSRFDQKIKNNSLFSGLYKFPYVLYRAFELQDWPTIRAKEVINTHTEDLECLSSPFFSWTHLMDLHAPIHPANHELGGEGLKSLIQHFIADAHRVANQRTELYHLIYDQTLKYVSYKIQSIIKKLKDLGVWESTIFVITGDHGEALFDRGMYGHDRNYLYDEVLNVPLIVRVPGIQGQRINQLFSLGWLADLLSEIIGIPSPNFPMSTDISMGKGKKIHLNDKVVSDTSSSNGNTICIQSHSENTRKKLIKHCSYGNNQPNYFKFTGDPTGYYDLAIDPTETHPLNIDRSPRELISELEEFKTDPDKLEKSRAEMDKKVLERLSNIGYKT